MRAETQAEALPGMVVPSRGSRLLLLAPALVALAVVAPFWFKGNASGHDFEFHLASWMEVARQWREGVLYPRWAELANFGYGEPRFIFYPPESWMLGAALSLVLPWRMVPGAFIWLALTACGLSMYRLAREWLPPADAMAAGVVFAVSPYHLVLVYWRSDFAELLASAIFPLMVLCLVRLPNQHRWSLLLALLMSATWLANAPAGVIATYTVAGLLALLALRERSWAIGFYGAAAVVLGMALAGFYLLPAAVEQPWVNIAEVLSSGLRPAENFLFTGTSDAEHRWFNALVSRAAMAEIAVVLLGGWLALPLRRANRRLWHVLAAVAVASVLLMFPVTSLLWRYLPKLRYVQFPWRWLLALDVCFAGFAASALARGPRRALAWAAALILLGLYGWGLTRSVWWDEGGVGEFQKAILKAGSGYEGSDEYMSRGGDRTDLVKTAPRVAETGAVGGLPRRAPTVRIERWYAENRDFAVTVEQPTTLILRLVNYPAWQARIDGQPAPAATSDDTGQMLLRVPAGTSRVQIHFSRTSDRLWGGAISLVALALFALAAPFLREDRRSARI